MYSQQKRSGKGSVGRDQGSLAPLPHLADEKTDSAAVSVLLMGTGQVCAELGWMGQNPSLEDAAATTCYKQHGAMGGQPAWGPGHLGPDSDSATHRVTLDTSRPSLGFRCSSSMTRGLD